MSTVMIFYSRINLIHIVIFYSSVSLLVQWIWNILLHENSVISIFQNEIEPIEQYVIQIITDGFSLKLDFPKGSKFGLFCRYYHYVFEK